MHIWARNEIGMCMYRIGESSCNELSAVGYLSCICLIKFNLFISSSACHAECMSLKHKFKYLPYLPAKTVFRSYRYRIKLCVEIYT